MIEPQTIPFDFSGQPTAGEILNRIRKDSRDESEKGHWFETLVMRIARQQPVFEIADIWSWLEWPQREELTGLDGQDIGIDLVARRTSGEWVAIQCKCYDERHRLRKGEIDKFLGGSQQKTFGLRWIVATCPWGPNAEKAIQNAHPQISQIDFRQYLDVEVGEEHAERPVQEPWDLQAEAIQYVKTGLANHDRGRLVMACGTGKTFTSLRIAEETVEDGGQILFAAPSIALVSQARREWLRQTTRKLACLVVCSDRTAGGRNTKAEDICVSELECPVTTDPARIADSLSDGDLTRVVFCTYHSLGRVTEAQENFGAPAFNLAIADEAHRTTGILRPKDGGKVDFQEFHDEERLLAHKRLYMTATSRIYDAKSKSRMEKKGIEVVDMDDCEVYGPELYRLPFGEAVKERMLSDYRVIVLGVSKASVTRGLRKQLEDLSVAKKTKEAPTINDMTRMLGVSQAVNGVTKGEALDQPGKLRRILVFANRIVRSRWYAKAFMLSEALRATTRGMRDGRAMKVIARHLDASSTALQRNQELRALAEAGKEGECRVVCNAKLFTEGVDVPQLDAVAFMDPRDSQVDVVQAVGRVMRKAEGKRFGYIIIPVVVEPGENVISALENDRDGYQTIGRALRALQAHDGRLVESLPDFVKVYEPPLPPGDGDGEGDGDGGITRGLFDLKEAGQGIYAHVVSASGLGNPGQLVADEITESVIAASKKLQGENLEVSLAKALDLVPEEGGGAKGICTIAALMLCNACLLQRRLRDEPGMETVHRLDEVAGAANRIEALKDAWRSILERDYEPVFRPALRVLGALQEGKVVDDAIRALVECANRVADSLSDLGYDHAGPLYHRILDSARSDGAFYTNNISAIMLARLAFPQGMIDWSDEKVVEKLRIMDPACGTGTLLMATLKTIKARVEASKKMDGKKINTLHKNLVENVLCGLDINQHAIQLAACNLTLGAPTVDYKRMNLVTMPHGPQKDGQPKAGSLEILTATDANRQDIQSIINPHRSIEALEGEQVNESPKVHFPLHGLDAVIMNAPFTANDKRSQKYSQSGRQAMQRHELGIKEHLQSKYGAAGGVVNSNSIGTYFTPLADILLNSSRGTLAKVIPTTACTNSSGLAERRFVAERFHVETIITSHDPKHLNFSENTGIHESLLICRRRTGEEREQPTGFVSLRTMPSNAKEAIEAVDAIQSGNAKKWGSIYYHPAELVRAGDWRPCQFLDADLVRAAMKIEQGGNLVPLGIRYLLGPAGQRIRAAFDRKDNGDSGRKSDNDGAYRVFWSRAKDLRSTMESVPEQIVIDKKPGLAGRYRNQAGHVMLASIFDTISGRMLSIYSKTPALGSMWVPVQARATSEDEAKALCAWFNSTPGALGFLMSRGTKLTNPSFSQAALTALRIPDFQRLSTKYLVDAYEREKNTEVVPWKGSADNKMRDTLDQAAAQTIGIGIETIRDWRLRISREPTISNRPVEKSDNKASREN